MATDWSFEKSRDWLIFQKKVSKKNQISLTLPFPREKNVFSQINFVLLLFYYFKFLSPTFFHCPFRQNCSHFLAKSPPVLPYDWRSTKNLRCLFAVRQTRKFPSTHVARPARPILHDWFLRVTHGWCVFNTRKLVPKIYLKHDALCPHSHPYAF